MKEIKIIGIERIPEISEDHNIAHEIIDATKKQKLTIEDGDILVIAQKIISKNEGKKVKLIKSNSLDELLELESAEVLRKRGQTIISKTKHGFICANAGIDNSNVEPGYALLLPDDPDESAKKIRSVIYSELNADIGIIISDTFGRVWRKGQVNMAIGISGIDPLLNYIGTKDTFKNELKVTEIAIVDEIASAAELVMGKADNIPVALIKNYTYRSSEDTIKKIIRPPSEDYFL